MTVELASATTPRHTHRPRRFNALDLVAIGFLVALIVAAAAAPWLAPSDPHEQDLVNAFADPSSAHLLGTDDLGRDNVSRLIHGARTSLLGPAIVVALAVLIGAPLAIVAAWYGRTVDRLIGRFVDLLLAFPGLLLAALATALFDPGLLTVSVALSIAYLPVITRITRSSALRERAKPYVAACQVQGMSVRRICLRHIAPNIAPVVISQSAVLFGYAIVDVAALSFLGFGVQAPAADWGLMVNSQTAVLSGEFTTPLLAGAVIVSCVLAVGRVAKTIGDDQ